MVVGDHRSFPYRSSTYITRFFERCGLAFRHDGSTRRWWAKDRLEELNLLPASSPDLPSDDLLVVISELFDRIDFDEQGKDLESALEALNKLLARDGLEAYLDDTSGRVTSATPEQAPDQKRLATANIRCPPKKPFYVTSLPPSLTPPARMSSQSVCSSPSSSGSDFIALLRRAIERRYWSSGKTSG